MDFGQFFNNPQQNATDDVITRLMKDGVDAYEQNSEKTPEQVLQRFQEIYGRDYKEKYLDALAPDAKQKMSEAMYGEIAKGGEPVLPTLMMYKAADLAVDVMKEMAFDMASDEDGLRIAMESAMHAAKVTQALNEDAKIDGERMSVSMGEEITKTMGVLTAAIFQIMQLSQTLEMELIRQGRRDDK